MICNPLHFLKKDLKSFYDSAGLTCFCTCASCSHKAAIRSLPSSALETAAIHMSLHLQADTENLPVSPNNINNNKTLFSCFQSCFFS